MSLAEAVDEPAEKPVEEAKFGEITIDQMRASEALTRMVMRVVSEACRRVKDRPGEPVTLESITRELTAGKLRLWGVAKLKNGAPDLKAVAVGRKRGDVFEVVLAGPDFEDVSPFLDLLEREARGARCQRMQFIGPPFVKKQLQGWYERWALVERALAD